MKYLKRLALLMPVILAGALMVAADDDSYPKFKITGLGSTEAGQVVKGENRQAREWETAPTIRHVWYQRSYLQLGVFAEISERTKATIIGEARVSYSWRTQQEFYDDLQPKYLFYPHHVEGSHSFGDVNKPYLRIGIGTFPYKYNPDVRNLGEYLYRTGTYPQYIASEFDFPLARLNGFYASSQLFDSLKLDLLFTAETQQLPFNDWGISLLVEYTIAKAFTLGAGVFFSHLFSVTDQYTTPHVSNNVSKIDTLMTATDTTYDTLFYSFKGQKLMARLAFDPKVLFNARIFGKNDLRVYAEVGIIGLKNYPGYYENRRERIPVVIGVNIPAFKLLDVLAFEGQYFGSKIPNSYQEVFYRRNLPIPDVQRMNDVSWDEYKENHWKWSFYATRRLANFFVLTGQVAKDHTRLLRHDQKNQDLEESMHQKDDWAWLLKCAFSF